MSEQGQDPPVTLVDLIGQLVPPDPPPPVSMLPQTAGWAVLAVLAGVAVVYGLWRWWRHYHANRYRRAALAALARAGGDPVAIAEVLRRTALVAFPRHEVAGLSGTEWLVFLDRTGGGGTAFTQGPGQALASAPYRSGSTAPSGLADLAARWIRRHRREVSR
ncbi:DUF4381 domain-containing protein [Ruegeria pomeroyi]|nr:DUF4381 domain-containing protein [Ruegeria pomeroyi]